MPTSQCTILLLVFGDLGDTLLTVPAIRAVRQSCPSARLVLLAKPEIGRLIHGLDLVDEVMAVDKHVFDSPKALLRPRPLLALMALLIRLRRRQIDTVVLFHHLVTRWGALKFALLSLATGASRRLGIDNGRGWFLTEAVKDRGFGDRHESQYYLDVAALLGREREASSAIPVSADAEQAADELLRKHGLGERRLGAIHPGTGPYSPARRWAPHRFAESAALIGRYHSVTWLLVGTEMDRESTGAVMDGLGSGILDLTGATSVPLLSALLARCDILLANDGGVGHLASAVGTPVISVFGPSNDRAWRPLTSTVIAADIPCRPCLYRDFERGLRAGCSTRECLQYVTPAMVAKAACDILDHASVAS